MSFIVLVRQTPEGQSTMLTTTELGTDGLQLRLIKDIRSVISVNGVRLNEAQKGTLRTLGTRWEVTDVQDGGGASVLVTARREGYMRTWSIDQNGVGMYADGHESRVAVTMQDPLNSAPWGADLTDMVQ